MTICGVLASSVIAAIVWFWPLVDRPALLKSELVSSDALIVKSENGVLDATRQLYEDARGSSSSVVGEKGETYIWLQALALQGTADAPRVSVSDIHAQPTPKRQTARVSITRADDSSDFKNAEQVLLELDKYAEQQIGDAMNARLLTFPALALSMNSRTG